jgi:methionyl-tRNA formyltransferase
MARIIFMGTPEFAVPTLKALIETQTVVGVVTQPDRPAGRGSLLRPSPVKQAAEAAGIPLYQPNSLRKEETAAPLEAWRPDVIVVAAFGQILRPHILYLPPHGSLNVHASLLPRWRGASPIQHALLAGDAETGISLMQMDEGLDTGPVYVQRAIPITSNDTAATLHDRLAELGAEMLCEYLDDILAGRLPATPQDDSCSTYAPMIRKEAGQMDWTKTARELDRQARAMTPWPGAFTNWRGETLRILQARPVQARSVQARLPSGQPGQVIMQDEQIVVLTGEGGLALQQIQLAGKRAMSADAFVNGRLDFIGSVLV